MRRFLRSLLLGLLVLVAVKYAVLASEGLRLIEHQDGPQAASEFRFGWFSHGIVSYFYFMFPRTLGLWDALLFAIAAGLAWRLARRPA